ncbi:hypothetical protein PYCCODRAFT_350432 [Trametes coccinea BRFM310]|uniref:Uncharacterized protein n=1 Tax=Trametes coccinea (strain BRFM310) TaxID=1353009 RepID=A0A1Y2J6D5_TRAC3|nr:hypothetical protein PYCCODRAFT_350432 [Trametes coccinea BRFM310]
MHFDQQSAWGWTSLWSRQRSVVPACRSQVCCASASPCFRIRVERSAKIPAKHRTLGSSEPPAFRDRIPAPPAAARAPSPDTAHEALLVWERVRGVKEEIRQLTSPCLPALDQLCNRTVLADTIITTARADACLHPAVSTAHCLPPNIHAPHSSSSSLRPPALHASSSSSASSSSIRCSGSVAPLQHGRNPTPIERYPQPSCTLSLSSPALQ